MPSECLQSRLMLVGNPLEKVKTIGSSCRNTDVWYLCETAGVIESAEDLKAQLLYNCCVFPALAEPKSESIQNTTENLVNS